MKRLSVLFVMFVIGLTAFAQLNPFEKDTKVLQRYEEVMMLRQLVSAKPQSQITEMHLELIGLLFPARSLGTMWAYIQRHGPITHWRMFSRTWSKTITPPAYWGATSIAKLAIFFKLQDEDLTYNCYPMYYLWLEDDFPAKSRCDD
jgi:hypothetical protein